MDFQNKNINILRVFEILLTKLKSKFKLKIR